MNNEPNNEFEELTEQSEPCEVSETEYSTPEDGEECQASEVLPPWIAPPIKKQKRKVKLSTLILSSVASLLCGAIITLTVVPNSLRLWAGGDTAYDKLAAIEKIVEENFIYMDEVDENQLADMLALGYVYGLGDPYSTYYNADQFSSVQSSNAGQSYGIGISAVMYEAGGGIYIADVTPNSPAELAGVKKGDIITAVDGVAVTTENYNQLIDAIRGDIGTPVKLSITRGEEKFELSPVRGEFVTLSVTGKLIDSVGYIKISTFNEATVPQFNTLLDLLIEKGAKGLVIDLRGNMGGLVNSASEMLDRLLPECDLGYAVYKDGTKKRLAKSDKDCVDLPMSVIIDGISASSSEYFAAALRDVAGANLIGEKSYGKGIMQTTYPLGDGSAVRVTVAEIYTAGSKRYHGKGLEPDVPVSYTEEQEKVWFLLEDRNDPYIAAAIDALK